MERNMKLENSFWDFQTTLVVVKDWFVSSGTWFRLKDFHAFKASIQKMTKWAWKKSFNADPSLPPFHQLLQHMLLRQQILRQSPLTLTCVIITEGGICQEHWSKKVKVETGVILHTAHMTAICFMVTTSIVWQPSLFLPLFPPLPPLPPLPPPRPHQHSSSSLPCIAFSKTQPPEKRLSGEVEPRANWVMVPRADVNTGVDCLVLKTMSANDYLGVSIWLYFNKVLFQVFFFHSLPPTSATKTSPIFKNKNKTNSKQHECQESRESVIHSHCVICVNCSNQWSTVIVTFILVVQDGPIQVFKNSKKIVCIL